MQQIPIIVEKQRANGYRKPGQFYLVGPKVPFQCCQIPKLLPESLPPHPGLLSIPSGLFMAPIVGKAHEPYCLEKDCPIINPASIAGMLWIPESEYSSAAMFFQEIRTAPVQIQMPGSAVDAMKLKGKWIMLAHRKAIVDYSDGPFAWVDSHTLQAETTIKYQPGIFTMFKVESVQFLTHQEKVTHRWKKIYRNYQKIGIELLTVVPDADIQRAGFVDAQVITLD